VVMGQIAGKGWRRRTFAEYSLPAAAQFTRI
jgi:hypothetical protein